MRRNNVGGFMSPAGGRAARRWRGLRQRIWSGRNRAQADLTPGSSAAALPAQGDVGNVAGTPRRQLVRRSVALVLSSVTALAGMVAGAAPASAQEPVYEIEGDWVDAPDTIDRGNPVVAEWRVNVNDAEEPPSNDPVDNVTATFTVDKAFFDGIPDICLTEDVDPVSSISEDGAELTCNFGTVNMGIAILVQTPVVADGVTGDEVVLDGTAPDGQNVELDPIPIANPFVMDIYYGQNSNNRGVWNDDFTEVNVDIQWSLRLGTGSDPGPPEVSYVLNVAEVDGAPVDVGVHPLSGLNCSPYDRWSVDGHPWSRSDIPPEHHRNTSFVDSCTLTERPGQPGVFDLTLSGINYDLMNVPTHDASQGGGNPLPPNWDYIASGSLWFSVDTDEAGSIQLESNAPTYTAPTGQTFTDLADNNTTNKSYTLPGSWSAAWERGYTQSGGTAWDDTYRVSAGTSVRQVVTNRFSGDGAPAGSQYGNCLALDTMFVTLESIDNSADGVAVWAGHSDNPPPVSSIIDTIPLQYYVGNHPLVDPASPLYDPDQFNCGVDPGNWTETPTDLTAVKAVRATYPFSQFAAEDAEWFQIRAVTAINDDVEVGEDVWMFGSYLRQGTWGGQDNENVITETPDARYDFTNGRRDIVRIIGALPHIEKEAARTTVTAGVPADFTLTYSATGSGIIPDTVDGYEIVDTLPVGMSYEPGSADPEPVVSMSGGQEVLTWTLNGVETNVEHELTYQAVADPSVEPGTQLTNTAVSSYEGESAEPVEETVTTTTNGYTAILKTSDVEFIPNEAGDGVGQGSWTVTIESVDQLPQAYTDTIDILPYNGDGRGTSFSGTYTLDDVVVPDGVTVYYTDEDPSTLSDDPTDEANGAPGDPTDNDVGWTTDKPDTVTAFRVIGGELAPGETLSFQLLITTDGASPGDVYVNRAQAVAEHTELVMRTSAELVVTDYVVVKTSDPEPGSTVEPGDTVEYTTTVTQQGPVPAGAFLTDTLDDVLDDATYNDDLEADMGEATYEDGVISWAGTIPVDEVATLTYSVTVNDTDDPEEIFLKNVVWSPGCVEPDNCTTEHPGPQPDLPETGADPAALVALAGALGLGGLVLMTASRRRARPSQQNEPLTNDPF